MNTAEKQEVIEATEFAVAEYSEFAAQMNELREHNKSVFFNYEDPKGNKEARSHIYKLRQTKAAIDKVRKKAGDDARKLLAEINSQGNALIAEVGDMIDHHQKHIDEVEEKERKRVADIQERIAAIAIYSECAGHDSRETAAALVHLKSVVIDTSYDEFMAQATTALNDAIAAQEAEHEKAVKREAEAAELERLRKEAAEREQKEREERIAKEAAERAKKEVEEAAAKEREAAAQREREYKEAAERAERERKEAAERAEREKLAAIEAEKKRAADEAAAKAAEDAKREADIKHQKEIHAAIIEGMGKCGVSEDAAKAVIVAIRKGEVPNIKIQY